MHHTQQTPPVAYQADVNGNPPADTDNTHANDEGEEENTAYTQTRINENEVGRSCTPLKPLQAGYKKRPSEASLDWEGSTIGIDPVDICSESSVESEAMESREVIRSLFENPSYWISCSYRYEYRRRNLEVIIRQTGNQPKVMAKSNFRRLSMEVKLDIRRKRCVTLMNSRSDTRFVSSHLVIEDVSRDRMNSMSLKLKVFSHFGLMKKVCLCKWIIPLEYCYYIQQTEFKKCLF